MNKFFAFVWVVLTLTSCLDEHPKNLLTEDEAYSSARNLYVNAVATLYNHIGGKADSQSLQGTYRGVYDYNTFCTDEAMIPIRGGDWYDGGFWENLYKHQWTPRDVPLYNTWLYLYKVVMLCNQSLQQLDKHANLLTHTQHEAYRAEVRAVRAMYYYYLMDMFGRIPIVTDCNTPIKELQQSSRSAAFRFIVSELQTVAPLLAGARSNVEGPYYGRITRPVVHFLLAKLALNAAIYTDDDWTDNSLPDGRNILFTVDGHKFNAWQTVIAYCDKITAAGYRLETDYRKNFAVVNENSQENIFTIPMDKTLYANLFKNLFRSRHYNHGSALGFGAENGASATLAAVRTYAYDTDSTDARYAMNCYSDTVRVDGRIVRLDNGDALVYRPLAIQLNLTGSQYERTAGARMSKYAIDRSAYSDGQLQNNDIVLFRYADVLLMKSEAKLRNGEDGSAELNRVRSRVGMKPRRATLSTLLAERLMELMWEGWRRQDLIRYGLFASAYDQRTPLDNEATGYTTVFPIPATVIALNGNMKQNPGYK